MFELPTFRKKKVKYSEKWAARRIIFPRFGKVQSPTDPYAFTRVFLLPGNYETRMSQSLKSRIWREVTTNED